MQTVTTGSISLVLAESARNELNAYSPVVGLYVNDLSPNPITGMADLVLAAFDGYTEKNSSFGPVFIDGNGQRTSLQNTQFYSTPQGNPTESVQGVFVRNTITGLIAAAKLDNPQRMGGSGDGLAVSLQLRNGVLTLSRQV